MTDQPEIAEEPTEALAPAPSFDDHLLTIRAEIAQLEVRIPELEQEQRQLNEEYGRLREEAVEAKVAGSALSAKSARAFIETESALALAGDALRSASARLARLRELEQAEVATVRHRSELAEYEAAADAMDEIIQNLDAVLETVRRTTTGERRASFHVELGSAFRQAVHASNNGNPASVKPALVELAKGYRATATGRGRFPAAPPPDPLPRDHLIYVKRGISWSDRGEPSIVKRTAQAGAIVAIPKAVADAAVLAGAAQRLPMTLCRVKVTETYSDETETGRRTWPKGFVGPVDPVIAQRMLAAGVIEKSDEIKLTDREIAEFRRSYPELTPTHVLDLGVFNDRVADGNRSLDALAGEPAMRAPKAARAKSPKELGAELRA